jgi:hypothetical protein
MLRWKKKSRSNTPFHWSVPNPYTALISGPKNCPIHGNWSDYINWTPCKNGKEKGFRFCTNPEPKYEGNDCEGEHFIIQDCNITYDGKKVSIFY